MPVLQTRQPLPGGKPKLLDQVRNASRRKHYSIRTEGAYIDWIKRYIFFHNKRHPAEMAEREIEQFLNHLAVRQKSCGFNSESSVERAGVSLSRSAPAGDWLDGKSATGKEAVSKPGVQSTDFSRALEVA